MFKFTKGKEIEELENLLKYKRIDSVYLAGFISLVKFRYIDGEFFHSSYDRYPLYSIIWESTRALVKEQKEEKMERIVVRGWEDLGEYATDSKYAGHKELYFGNENIIINNAYLKLATALLNKSGGNFEYKPVEVIDTYEKFHSFLEKMYSKVDDRIFYTLNYECKNFLKFGATHQNFLKSCSVEEIEEKYNVKLKILDQLKIGGVR